METQNLKIKLCGLYERKTKNGDTFFSGKLSNSSSIIIFKNSYKKEEKDADYVLYLQPFSDKPKQQVEPTLEETPF